MFINENNFKKENSEIKINVQGRISDKYLDPSNFENLERNNDVYNYMHFSQNLFKFISDKKNAIKLESVS